MRELKRKMLYEENNNDMVSKLTADIESGKITTKDLEDLVNNGQLSEEDFATLSEKATEQEANNIIDSINNGSIDINNLDTMLKNGEISQNAFDIVNNELNNSQEQQENNDQEVQPEDQQDMDNQDYQDQENDQDYMNQDQEQEEEPQPIDGNFNSVRLLEKFIELKKYLDIYIDSYNDIETDELHALQVSSISKLYSEIYDLQEKLKFYIENNYDTSDYKKNLYSYLLFNNEFANEIRRFRKALNLNPNKLIDETNNKK